MWTCSVWPFMSLSVAFISFAEKSSHRFLPIFCLSYWGYCSHWIKKWGSPCSFIRKGAFISLSSLVWGKSFTFCTHTQSCARAYDANIVRSKNAQCKTKEARKGFLLLQCLWNDGRLQRRIFNGVGKLYVSLQLYCWAILWGYLWRHISYHGNAQGPQKRPVNFSFCKLSEKLIRRPIIFISFFDSSLNSLTFQAVWKKIYLVKLTTFKENAINGLQEILLDNFPRNFYIWSATVNGACMQKIKIGHRAKFRAGNKYFVLILFPVRAIFRKI